MRKGPKLSSKFGSTLLFIALQVLCFFILIQNSRRHQVYLSTSNAFLGFVNKKLTGISDYFKLDDQNEMLHKENDSLLAENARLRAMLDSAYYTKTLPKDSVIHDSLKLKFSYITANVINNSITGNNNMLTLDRGWKDGVKSHMGVVGGNGIAGIVVNVSKNYALAMSVLNRQIRISASIKNSGYFGSLVWRKNNPQYMQLEAIPKHASVDTAYHVETSGFSNIFPEGIPIGVVEKVKIKPEDSFYNIDVKLHNDMAKLRFVYIVKNLKKPKLTESQQGNNE